MKNILRELYAERRNDVINTLSSSIHDDDCRDKIHNKISLVIHEILLRSTGLLSDVDVDTISAYLDIYSELVSIYIQEELEDDEILLDVIDEQ